MIAKYRSAVSNVVVIFTVAFFLPSCINEREEIAKEKLNLILPEDMKAIVEGIPAESLIAKPYYKVTYYNTYKKGMYSAKAEVDFYFLKKLDLKIIRKFRYHRSKRVWERYFNEYRYFSDTANQKK